MSITRADKLTEAAKKIETFSDFVTSFFTHPISGKLMKVTNEDAVIQALKNKILTNFGEVLYRPNQGCNIRKSLFEMNDTFMKEDINNAIKNSIQNDKRVELLSVNIDTDDYEVTVNITVFIINTQDPVSFNIILKKVR